MTAQTSDRLAYSADHVVYLIEAEHIAALWTSDPELAAQGGAALFERMLDRTVEIELLGEANRLYKNRGALYSGWMLNIHANHLDPIGRRADAIAALRELVAEHFAAISARQAPEAAQ